MIKELTTLKEEEAEEVLSEIVSRLLPNPENGTEEESPRKSGAEAIVAAVELYIQKGGPRARIEVLDYASDRMSGRYLTEEAVADVRSRLGTAGKLPLHQYRLVFDAATTKVLACLAIRNSHVEDAIYHSDKVQQLTPEDFKAPAGQLPRMTLFVKYQRGEAREPYALFVHCVHEKDELRVWQAWRIYDRDIDARTEDLDPLAMLKRFIDRYGVNFTFAGTGDLKKLLLYEVVPVGPDDRGLNLLSERVGGYSIRQLFVRKSYLGAAVIVFAYLINLTRYVSDLGRHGLSVDPGPAGLGSLKGVETTQMVSITI